LAEGLIISAVSSFPTDQLRRLKLPSALEAHFFGGLIQNLFYLSRFPDQLTRPYWIFLQPSKLTART
jgi:hypothetical protein